MKIRVFVLIVCMLLTLSFFSCKGNEKEFTTDKTASLEETTEKPHPTVSEMSPEECDVALPIKTEKNFNLLNLSEFKEIEAKDGILKGKRASKILKGGNAEYYFMNDNEKIIAVILDDDGTPEYSACYNMGSGILEYIGNDEKSWYFTETGELKYIALTYSPFPGAAGIVTYYTPDGKRDFVVAAGEYYNGNLDLLSDEEAMAFVTKYAGAAEFIKK